MDRLRRLFADLWDWMRRMAGFDRLKKSKRQEDLSGRPKFWALFYFFRPIVALTFIVYFVLLVTRFAIINGDDLQYPQRILPPDIQQAVEPGARFADGGCAPSQTVALTSYILDVLVNQNTWVPADPQFKIGWFMIIGFEPTPFFDNKASFQRGALRAVRRMSVELVDLLGRARGTSAPDQDLIDARGAVQWNERAWIVNPFDSRLPLLSTSAASSYRSAIGNYDAYNNRLMACNALFDARSDNLFQILDRIANDVGGMTDQLAQRSKGMRWDVDTKSMIQGDGNNRGVFDFRADNLFWEAHGLIWAYHGILQALRYDFKAVVRASNLSQIWDRMETHVAEAAALSPSIVSNGREDSVLFPDHLSAMAANMLRARANMVELREILNR
jgi:hypothetical protein